MAWDTTGATLTWHTVAKSADYETQFGRRSILEGGDYVYRKRLVTVHEQRVRCVDETLANATVTANTSVTVDDSGNVTRVRAEARRADDSGQYHVHRFTTYTPAWGEDDWVVWKEN